MSSNLLISIITINYNNLNGLEETIKSVHSQSYKGFEHIIIDGNSDDGSYDLIQSNKHLFSYWVSEPDKGIFHAMNKGIKVAKGEYLIFLNSGDTFYDENSLKQAVSIISDEYPIYYGDVQRIFPDGRKTIKTYPKELSFSFFVGSAIAHQSSIVKKSLFEQLFYFNEDYKMFGDWEFFVYAICKHNLPYKHLGFVVVNFDMTGISTSLENQKALEYEMIETYQKYFPLFYEDYKELFRLKLLHNTQRMKLFLKLEKYPILRKINYSLLRIVNVFLK